MRHGVSLLKGV